MSKQLINSLEVRKVSPIFLSRNKQINKSIFILILETTSSSPDDEPVHHFAFAGDAGKVQRKFCCKFVL